MVLQMIPYFIAMLVTSCITLLLAGYAAQRRSAPGWLYFVLAMLALSWWSIAYALELAVIPFSARIFFNNLSFAGAHSLAPLWFLFCIHYVNRRQRLSIPWQLALFILPVFIVVLAFTNSYHGWVWTSITPISVAQGSFLSYQYGPAFWLGAVYAYSLLLAGSIAIGKGLLQAPPLYRRQTGLLLASAVIPWISNFLYIIGLNPFPGLDLTPLTFCVSAIFVTAALFRYRLLEMLPIAYDVLFARMENEVLVLDEYDRLLEANPAARHLFGLDDSHIGQPAQSWLVETPELMCLFEDSDQDNCEVCLQTPDGQLWRGVQSAPLYTENQEANGRLIVLNDITHRRIAEGEIRQAHQKAIEASQMKTRLLASVSHDLRSPMSAIMGYAEMLRTGLLGEVTPQQSGALDQILDSAHQQLTFVNNLIGQAQLETGRVILNYQQFTYQDLLQPVKSTLGMIAARKNLELVFEVDPDLPVQLYGDPYWLRQVLLNLVNNAIKFTQRGQVKVSLFQSRPDTWAFQVSDTGVGIPKDKQRVVFEPFHQLHNEHASQTGSGLGLAIVSQLVDLMQGQVLLESEPGRGSTFTIMMPYEPVLELADAIALQDTAPVR